MKKLLIIFVLIGIITLYLVLNKCIRNKPVESNPQNIVANTPTPTISIPEISTKIIESQKPVADKYINLKIDQKDKVALFYDLFSPLGPLDPISPNILDKPVKEISNFIYGYYGKKFGIDQITVTNLPSLATRYAVNEYNPTVDFIKYKKYFQSINKQMLEDNQIRLIGSWSIGIYRLNNYFVDTKRNLVWKTSNDNEGQQIYEIIDDKNINNLPNNPDSKELIDITNKYKGLYKATTIPSIHTAYSCDGKVIYIIGGTANNGQGFIYNASDKEDVNCGLLKNRFEIVVFSEIESDWHYWVGI